MGVRANGGKRDYPCRGLQPNEVVRPEDKSLWQRWAYITMDSVNNVLTHKELYDVHDVHAINAACNATIVLDRMIRRGKMAGR